jgi:hypothetical protein
MILSTRRFSLHQFQYFLKLIGKEGLAYETTLDQWREVARTFEPFFTRAEKRDLRCVDLKQLGHSYASTVVERGASITPWRILMLESQMAAVLGEFIAFSINPVQYRENRRPVTAKLHLERAVA